MSNNKIQTSFARPDDFYDLPDDKAKALVGTSFQCDDRPSYTFWVVDLALDEFNYGHPQGLIFIFEPRKEEPDGPHWFRVGAFSPDDLDVDLDFECLTARKARSQYKKVVACLKSIPKSRVTYRGFMKEVQDQVGAGEITS